MFNCPHTSTISVNVQITGNDIDKLAVLADGTTQSAEERETELVFLKAAKGDAYIETGEGKVRVSLVVHKGESYEGGALKWQKEQYS